MDRRSLQQIAEELRPLAGARIQRIDRIDEGEWVIEVRIPGRTLRLLVATHPEPWLGLLPARPGRRVDGGGPQGLLRKRLVGRKLALLEVADRALVLEAGESRITFSRDRRGAVNASPSAGRLPGDGEPVPEQFPTAEAAGRKYLQRSPERAHDSRRLQLERIVRAARKKKSRLLRRVAGDRARMEALARQGQFGELLKPALASIPRGARQAEVLDWTSGHTVNVSLDPALSARDNMKRFFAQARRGARGLPRTDERLTAVQAELDVLDQVLARLADQVSAHDEDVFAALAADLARIGLSVGSLSGLGQGRAARAQRSATDPLDRFSRRFSATDGTEIRVGKGAEGNDRLTASARAADIWLHARGVPGAHVVLRARPGRAPDSEALVDAAHLAAHFSSAKNDARVDVLYTEARHVRKTKGAPAGQVGVARSRTMRVAMDPRRISRLLESKKL